jgi:type IV secretory pathway VirB2 component (pilin)
MDGFIVFKYLHIVAMFFFVAMALSGEIVTRRVAMSEDVGAIRTTVKSVKVLVGPVAMGLLVSGLVFGFIAALTGQMNLLAPWLILAYVAVAAAAVLGFAVTDPWVGRLERAAESSPVDSPSSELIAVIHEPVARYATFALVFLDAFLVFVMVVKPLS